MKKAVICFFVFVITGLSSAFLGVSGDMTFVIGAICALLYLVFSRKTDNSTKERGSAYSSNSRSSIAKEIDDKIILLQGYCYHIFYCGQKE